MNPAMEPAMISPVTNPSGMEPVMPPEEGQRRLEDAAFDLASRASSLTGQTNPIVTASVATLVRSMNCYHSNIIEGHDTHPRDIDDALRKDYSVDPARRALQLEAVAHIEIQQAIDEVRDGPAFPASLRTSSSLRSRGLLASSSMKHSACNSPQKLGCLWPGRTALHRQGRWFTDSLSRRDPLIWKNLDSFDGAQRFFGLLIPASSNHISSAGSINRHNAEMLV
jgi:hypothetical protein